MSIAVPQRRIGLIVLVLVIDLGLAATGAILLAKGLSKPDPAPAPASHASLAPSPPPPPPSASPSPPPSPPPASPSPPPPPPAKQIASRPAAPHHLTKALAASAPVATATASLAASAPVDPYPSSTPDLASLVDARVAAAQPDFARCAQPAGAVHGTLRIAFRVQPDGSVAHAAAVENTTGSDALASCLTSVIAAFAFAPHSGESADFVRPFEYP